MHKYSECFGVEKVKTTVAGMLLFLVFTVALFTYSIYKAFEVGM